MLAALSIPSDHHREGQALVVEPLLGVKNGCPSDIVNGCVMT